MVACNMILINFYGTVSLGKKYLGGHTLWIDITDGGLSSIINVVREYFYEYYWFLKKTLKSNILLKVFYRQSPFRLPQTEFYLTLRCPLTATLRQSVIGRLNANNLVYVIDDMCSCAWLRSNQSKDQFRQSRSTSSVGARACVTQRPVYDLSWKVHGEYVCVYMYVLHNWIMNLSVYSTRYIYLLAL